MRILKCWIIGLGFSLIVVVSDISGPHTPFGILAIVFGLPMFIAKGILTRDSTENHYALMVFSGSLFYGLVLYVIAVVVQRLLSKKPGTQI